MPFKILLGAVLLILALIGALAFIEPIEGLTGINHPEFSKIKIGPDTVGMHTHTKWISFAMAITIIGIFISVLHIGSRKGGKITGMARWIFAFGVLYTMVFCGMIFSNWSYLNNETNSFWGQMPAPTAWMIYAVWLCPLFIALTYVFAFDKWVISPEEERDLLQWIKENQE